MILQVLQAVYKTISSYVIIFRKSIRRGKCGSEGSFHQPGHENVEQRSKLKSTVVAKPMGKPN
jgi:hypothetical protein